MRSVLVREKRAALVRAKRAVTSIVCSPPPGLTGRHKGSEYRMLVSFVVEFEFSIFVTLLVAASVFITFFMGRLEVSWYTQVFA